MFARIYLIPISTLLFTGSLLGQIPDEFTNLQQLPKNIGKRELINVMRAYTGALGVRCLHCHIGTDGNNFTDVVFSADDRETKKLARVMIEMTREINRTLEAKSGRPLDKLTEVTCQTCHHGATEPKDLRTEMTIAYDAGGAEALLTRYAELRSEFYGRSLYDFKHSTLTNLADSFSRQHDDLNGAIKIMVANLTYFPDSHYSWYMLGIAYHNDGNKAKAIEAAERSIKLDPENSWYKANLEEFRK